VQKEKVSGKIIDLRILKRLYRYTKPYAGRFYALVFLTVALGVIGPIRPLLVSKAIDDHIAIGDYHGLLFITVILISLITISGIFEYFHTYLSGWLGQYIIKDIRVNLFEHLLKMRLKFFDRTPIGRLVTRNVSDIETLSEVFSQGIAALIADVLQLVFILIFMFYLDWKLTIMSLSTLPLLVVSTYIFKEKIKEAFNEVRVAVANLNTFVQEHITGMTVVQLFSSEDREFNKFKEINKEHRRANIKSVLYYSVYYPVSEVTFGDLTAFIMYLNMFFRPIRQIADRYNTLQMGIVSSSRIFDLLDSQDQIPNNGHVVANVLDGRVEFKDVTFAYNEEDWVLRNISFHVEYGKTLALVGATGAGKSSIINLLTRFYDIKHGEILVDGVSVKDYELKSLRKHIGVVLQDVFLFSDTIETNITLGDPTITRKQIYDTAELVGALPFIERLPGKLDYNVMERGATLSVGQRQLISFIRTMVYDPRILILDEATSSVDSETEELIQNAIQKMMSGRTSIVIAHRLSTIQNADTIIVLDHGKIVESGSHSKLLELGGFYEQLYNMQYKAMVH